MRPAIFLCALLATFSGPGAYGTPALGPPSSLAPRPAGSREAQTIDGVAARIEDDIITESEVRELGAFQELVDGHSQSRVERIEELADQWIVRGEANAVKYPRPSGDDVDRAYAQFVKQFPSPEDFKARCTAKGLDEAAVRRILEQQVFLSRFLDYRFRPAAQVEEGEIKTFYDSEFVPQLQARSQPVPLLEDVADTIREILIQRAINDRAKAWLDETRNRLKIDIVAEGAAS
jgi:hypothetical protein